MTTYVVCDIEADGPVPGPHSMFSLGAVAVNKNGEQFGEFEINFLPLKNAKPHHMYFDCVLLITSSASIG